MNKVLLVGRLTRDPEIRTTQEGTKVATFTLAVDRRYKDKAGNPQADFIPCVAWRTSAEFVEKYFRKGMRVGVDGSMQTRNYEDNNKNRRYVTEVICEHVEFCESKQESAAPVQAPVNTFTEVEDGSLPF